MSGLKITQYSEEYRDEWETVVSNAKHEFFQVSRAFMDYHLHRFREISFIISDKKGPIGVFPAIKASASEIVSHPGLTFGGFSFVRRVRTADAIAGMQAIINRYKEFGILEIEIRAIPNEFHNHPCGEIGFGLHKLGFERKEVELSSFLVLRRRLGFNSLKRRGVRKAQKNGIAIKKIGCRDVHSLIAKTLEDRHEAKIVHSADELEYLETKLDGRVFALGAYMGNELMAAIVVFCYGKVWHTQYLAASEQGSQFGALDLAVCKLLIEADRSEVDAISFGVSVDPRTGQVNEGLLWQKESFGARALCHECLRYRD